MRASIRPGTRHLVLGVDLVKDRERMVKAYDDAAGTTRQFNLNMLNVLNRLLGGEFNPAKFDHVALWSEEHSRIEMRLRAREAMKIRLDLLDTVVAFEDGEEIRTEISTKFRRETVERELIGVGLELAGWWNDNGPAAHGEPDGDYAVVVGVRT